SNLSGIVAGDTVATTLVRSNSANWDSSYTTVQSNSATTWNYQGTDLKSLSSGWVGGNSAFTTVQSNSATNWDNSLSNQYTRTYFLPLSGGTLTGTLISDVSATGSFYGDGSKLTGIVAVDTGVRALTSNWQSTYTSYNSNSASFVTTSNLSGIVGDSGGASAIRVLTQAEYNAITVPTVSTIYIITP
ncbi:hypothetical protein EB001_25430, partial [bacterium]|nr:hypothetical protein [bacterium]